MSIDYALAQRLVRKHKAALTRAKNTRDPHKVIAAVDAAYAEWDANDIPYPDSWHTWERAKSDALVAIAYDHPFRG
jgi:hypothetical protein